MRKRIALSTLLLILAPVTLLLADTFNYVTIDVPGAIQTAVGGINNSGELVGGYQLPDMSRHGFLDVSWGVYHHR